MIHLLIIWIYINGFINGLKIWQLPIDVFINEQPLWKPFRPTITLILFPDRSKPSRGQVQDLLARLPIVVATTTSSSPSEWSPSVFCETARTRWARPLPPPLSSPHPFVLLPFLHLPPSHLQVLHHPVLLKAWISKSSKTHPGQLSSSKNLRWILSVK